VGHRKVSTERKFENLTAEGGRAQISILVVPDR